MLRPVKITTSNFLGYLGLEFGFAFRIQKVFTILFHRLIIGLHGVTDKKMLFKSILPKGNVWYQPPGLVGVRFGLGSWL